MEDSTFGYKLSIEHNYILVELWGKMHLEGIEKVTDELLGLAEQHHIKRVLYDASKLEKTDSELRKKNIELFKSVSQQMDRLASYVPDPKIYLLAKFMSLLSGIKNWKPFDKKEKAIQWLTS